MFRFHNKMGAPLIALSVAISICSYSPLVGQAPDVLIDPGHAYSHVACY